MKNLFFFFLLLSSFVQGQVKISDMQLYTGPGPIYAPVIVNGVNRKFDIGAVRDSNANKVIITTVAALPSLTNVPYNATITTTDILGNWYVDPNDLTSPDNYGTIRVNGTKRIKRIYSGTTVNVKWFGAIGDGVTDDRQAIYRAINSGASIVEFPDGNYFSSDSISVKRPVRIKGSSNWMGTIGTTVTFASGKYGFVFERYNTPIPLGGAAGVNLGNASDGSEIDHLTINQQAPITIGHAIWAHCRINAHDLGINNFGGDGIHIEANYQPASGYSTVQVVNMNNMGSGYTTAPTVAITGDGTGAKGHAVLGFAVTSTTVTNGGLYSGAPTVSIYDNNTWDATGFGASYNAVMGVANATVTAGGSGYTTATATISGDGTGATATVQITAGAVSGITITNPGSGYSTAPTITISGNGTGATATTLLKVVSLFANNYGGLYEVVPTITFSGGQLTPSATGGAVATATLGSGVVKKVIVDSIGNNYSYASLTFTGGGGTGAIATPWLGKYIEGNANNWKIQNVRIVNCANGVFVGGGDANAGYSNGVSVTGCRLNGIWDHSFLGNKHASAHTETCIMHPYFVDQYASLTDFDNCYSEGGQLPSYAQYNTTFRGGDHGAGIDYRGGNAITGATDSHVSVTSTGIKDQITINIGSNPDNGSIEELSNTAVPSGYTVRRKIAPITGDISMDAANVTDRRWYLQTNTNTQIKFARNETVPYATYIDRLFVGNDGRQVTGSTIFPPAMKPLQTQWAVGDFVFNHSASVSNGVIGWARLTTGSGNVIGIDWLEVKGGNFTTTLDSVLARGNTSTRTANLGAVQIGTSGVGWNVSPSVISGRYGTANASLFRLENYYGDAGGNLTYMSYNSKFTTGGWVQDDNTRGSIMMVAGRYSGGNPTSDMIFYRINAGSTVLDEVLAVKSDGTVKVSNGPLTVSGTVSAAPATAAANAVIKSQYDSLNNAAVHLSGTETISGAKNFTVQPTSIAPTAANHVTTKIYVDSLGVNVDNVTIRDTTINGVKAIYATPQSGNSGTVTSVSVTNANGFTGTVATATTTPAISIGTSLNGLLKGTGAGIALAAGGADFAFPNLGYTSVTAAGTTQGTATAVSGPNSIVQVATVPAGSGIILPGAQQYSRIVVSNRGTNALLVYPYSTHTINNLSSSAAYSLPAGATQTFNGLSSLAWQTSTTFTGGDVNNTDANGALTLPNVNANVGTWNSVTVNAKGLVTAGSNITYTGTVKVLPDANYTVTSSDRTLILTTPAATRTLTLVPASAMPNQEINIQCRATTTGAWMLSGSFVSKGTTGSNPISETFVNSGLVTGTNYRLFSDGNKWYEQ